MASSLRYAGASLDSRASERVLLQAALFGTNLPFARFVGMGAKEEDYRQRAEEVDRMGDTAWDSEAKRILREIATHWRSLADWVKQKSWEAP